MHSYSRTCFVCAVATVQKALTENDTWDFCGNTGTVMPLGGATHPAAGITAAVAGGPAPRLVEMLALQSVN